MELWHSEIRLPTGFVAPTERVTLEWSIHADRARKDDRYAEIPKFKTIPLSVFSVIEVETTGSKVSKLVMRGHWTADLDVVFVLIPGPVYFVKTVWINKRNDVHKTLDRSKYVS